MAVRLYAARTALLIYLASKNFSKKFFEKNIEFDDCVRMLNVCILIDLCSYRIMTENPYQQ